MDSFIARQPILDRRGNTCAYELLFRSGETNAFPDIEGDVATSSVLSSTFFTAGVEKICSGRVAFINFPESHLLKGTPGLFHKESLVVEILEDVKATEAVVAQCRKLKAEGYRLALDDFVWDKGLAELIQLADIIKFDLRLTPLDELKELLPKMNLPAKCRLLAEKIETKEEFNDAVEMGFYYFQGYFFARPEIIKNRDIPGSKLNMLQLLGKLNTPDYDIEEIEHLVGQDVAITYKLLNYINSARFARLSPLSSIRQAIAFLGEREFRTFVTLLASACLNDDKPDELIRMSIIRARFLEQIATGNKAESRERFLLGLFSLIDAMLDREMAQVVGGLSLSPALEDALIHRRGDLAPWLRLVESYERGLWVPFRLALKRVKFDDEELVAATWLDAITWVDEFTEQAKV